MVRTTCAFAVDLNLRGRIAHLRMVLAWRIKRLMVE